MEFHDLAISAFLEMKKTDPTITLGHDSPFLDRATKHAVKRLARKPDTYFELKVNCCVHNHNGAEVFSPRHPTII
jgi:hypothetical protein